MTRPTNVVIVGAPRSGTNMLRDVLTAFPDVGTWPCDEINLIWRHGNRDIPHDELTAAHARPEVSGYLRAQFEKVRWREDAAVVVEKTCATSLRVAFARAVLPEAKFVFIHRDGLDAAASAVTRWHAPLDLGYTARKARFVPPGDLPHYGWRFVSTQVRRRRRRVRPADPRLDTWWGPKPRDYRELMSRPLDEVCALQWQRCVDASLRDLPDLPESQVACVRYEDFVADPGTHTRRLTRFLGVGDAGWEQAVAGVSAASVGKGRALLGDEARARLGRLVGSTLTELGYDR